MFTISDKKWLKDNFATKDDFRKSATKDDLKDFAKKADLKQFATKDDLKKIDKRFDKLDKKFIDLFDLLDKDVMENKRKIKTIEQVLQISSVS